MKTAPNPQRIKSLTNSAILRKKFVQEISIKEENAAILMCDIYEGILELLHALVIKEGYKVKNHVCLGYYIKDILRKEEIFIKFDRYRKLRNDILYYGKSIEKEQAKQEIENMIALFEEIKRLI